MIKANELRIGNRLKWHDNSQIFDVLPALFAEMPFWTHVERGDIVGIPLTEEWLERTGFERVDKEPDDEFEEMYENQLGNQIDKENGRYKYWISSRYGDYVELKTVHQLQNLYFALTGEELTIKP